MYNMDILIHIVDTVHLKVNALILSYANPFHYARPCLYNPFRLSLHQLLGKLLYIYTLTLLYISAIINAKSVEVFPECVHFPPDPSIHHQKLLFTVDFDTV